MTTPWIICGYAACLWSDLREFYDLTGIRPHDVPLIAVNGAIAEPALRPIREGVTLHFDISASYRRPWNEHVPIWSFDRQCAVTDVMPQIEGWHGGSGLYAVSVALYQGASRIILAGMPMDDGPRMDGARSLVDDLQFYRAGWRNALPVMATRVRSMSGWTRELLGAPTAEDYR